MFTEDFKQRIIAALVEKKAVLPCARCGHEKFAVLDGYGIQSLQEHQLGLYLGGVAVPCAVISCRHCGHISLHALGALGLLEQEDNPKPDSSAEKATVPASGEEAQR